MLTDRIARRYMASKKSHAAVNIISYVSIAGIAVGAAAMVIVLSVFNGFSALVDSRLSALDPDFAVTATEGKGVGDADALAAAISAVPGVENAVPGVEERGFMTHGGRQMPVVLTGVADDDPLTGRLRGMLLDGTNFLGLSDDSIATTILTVGAANTLMAPPDPYNPLYINVPRRRGRINPALPHMAFRTDSVVVAGVVRTDRQELDGDHIFVPLSVARKLLDYGDRATAVNIYLQEGAEPAALRRSVSEKLPDGLQLLDRRQMHEEAFRMVNIEKYVTLLVLVFILIIASFNILSTMAMLIVEKQPNIAIFTAMGADRPFIRSIFRQLTLRINCTGGLIGIVLGVGVALLQQCCGIVKLNASDPTALAVSAYPVRVLPADILIVAAVVAAIGFVSAAIVSRGLKNILKQTQTQ